MKFNVVNNQEDLNKAIEIRVDVFVHEQGVPLELEVDEFDTLEAPCKHLLVYHEGKAVGVGRVRFVEEFGKLERICILKEYRQFGLGRVIVEALEEIARDNGAKKVKLHGQTHAQGFYEKLAYHTVGEEFMEDGIPHILMVKEL